MNRSNMFQKHVLGHNWGRYAIFWHAEEGNLREIARSTYLDDSRFVPACLPPARLALVSTFCCTGVHSPAKSNCSHSVPQCNWGPKGPPEFDGPLGASRAWWAPLPISTMKALAKTQLPQWSYEAESGSLHSLANGLEPDFLFYTAHGIDNQVVEISHIYIYIYIYNMYKYTHIYIYIICIYIVRSQLGSSSQSQITHVAKRKQQQVLLTLLNFLRSRSYRNCSDRHG